MAEVPRREEVGDFRGRDARARIEAFPPAGANAAENAMHGWIDVGTVRGSRRVDGRVGVIPHSGDPAGLLAVRTVRLVRSTRDGTRSREFGVVSAQRSGRCAVFSFRGLESPEGAQEWAGASAYVPRGELPEPDAGEYYWADLAGCAAVGPDGSPVGTVDGVEAGPAHDWLRIRCCAEAGGTGEEKLLPLVAAFVREVDVAGRRIVVAPPEGW